MDSPQSCPSCGRKLSPKFTACPYCHAELAPRGAEPAAADSATKAPVPSQTATARTCPNCEAVLEPGAVGCSTCGHGKPETPGSPARLAKLALLPIGIAAMVVIIVILAVRMHGVSKEQERVVASGGKVDDGQLLEQVYAAFRAGDLAGYQKVTVTPADFLALSQVDELAEQQERATGRKPNIVGRKMIAGQTYAGSVLVPEQRKLQEDDFRKVLAGGPGFIDFKAMTFKGVGTLVTSDSIPNLEGPPIPVRVFSVRVEGPDGELDTKALAPLFVVTDYQGNPALIGLRMPQKN